MLCTEEGCTQSASYTYVWPWGTQGACCAQHATVLNQKATQELNIEQGLRMVAIKTGEMPALSRDERVQHKALVMTLEEENVSLKAQITNLERALGENAIETQRITGRANQLERSLGDLQVKYDQALAERDAANAHAFDLNKENQRLTLILNIPSAVTPASDTTPAPATDK